jgi:urease accessory protein
MPALRMRAKRRMAAKNMIMTIVMRTMNTTRTMDITGMNIDVPITALAAGSAEPLPLPLFIWLSPAFPVGAFAYSHGLEWAVESGDVHDGESLRLWLVDLIEHGSLCNDCVLVAAAWRAAGRAAELAEINALALALAPSAERYLETSAQGNAFVKALAQAWPCSSPIGLAMDGADIAYPVALGAAAADTSIGLEATLAAFTLAFEGNLASAALRLGTIGQSEALKLTASLLPLLQNLAHWAAQTTLDDLGGCAFRADIASLRHETQYSRLFRS